MKLLPEVFCFIKHQSKSSFYFRVSQEKCLYCIFTRNALGKGILWYNGETNGVPTLYCPMETPIPVGVAILMKKGTDRTIHSKIIDSHGRYIILKADIADHKYTLINTYPPNKDNDIVNFFEKLRKTTTYLKTISTQMKKLLLEVT